MHGSRSKIPRKKSHLAAEGFNSGVKGLILISSLFVPCSLLAGRIVEIVVAAVLRDI
jgi:hypothetical protein